MEPDSTPPVVLSYATPSRVGSPWPASVGYAVSAVLGVPLLVPRMRVGLTDPQFTDPYVYSATLYGFSIFLMAMLAFSARSVLIFAATKTRRVYRRFSWAVGLAGGFIGLPPLMVGIDWSANSKTNLWFLLALPLVPMSFLLTAFFALGKRTS